MSRILSDEVANDPLGRGYAAMSDQQLLESLNAVDRNRSRVTATGAELAEQISQPEYNALADAKKQQFLELVKGESLDLSGFAGEVIKDIFSAGSQTVRNLNTKRGQREKMSRAEEVGWSGPVKMKDLRMHTLDRKVPR